MDATLTFSIAGLIKEINRLWGEKGVKKGASPRGEPWVGGNKQGLTTGGDRLEKPKIISEMTLNSSNHILSKPKWVRV
jgi:hypothetical protein